MTSQELLPKVSDLIKDLPTVRTVIYIENVIKCGSSVTWNHQHVQLVPFQHLDVAPSAKTASEITNPGPDDVAVIMYTSGSTGQPKGVMLTHANLLSSLLNACVLGCNLMGEKRSPDEAYLAYLPLAHIFELTHEILVLSLGIKVGYSSPNTLTGEDLLPQFLFLCPTPILMAFIGVTNAHGPSPQPTACRSPICSLITATGSNQP